MKLKAKCVNVVCGKNGEPAMVEPRYDHGQFTSTCPECRHYLEEIKEPNSFGKVGGPHERKTKLR